MRLECHTFVHCLTALATGAMRPLELFHCSFTRSRIFSWNAACSARRRSISRESDAPLPLQEARDTKSSGFSRWCWWPLRNMVTFSVVVDSGFFLTTTLRFERGRRRVRCLCGSGLRRRRAKFDAGAVRGRVSVWAFGPPARGPWRPGEAGDAWAWMAMGFRGRGRRVPDVRLVAMSKSMSGSGPGVASPGESGVAGLVGDDGGGGDGAGDGVGGGEGDGAGGPVEESRPCLPSASSHASTSAPVWTECTASSPPCATPLMSLSCVLSGGGDGAGEGVAEVVVGSGDWWRGLAAGDATGSGDWTGDGECVGDTVGVAWAGAGEGGSLLVWDRPDFG